MGKIVVHPGTIIINEICQFVDKPYLKVFYIECKSKYAEILSTGYIYTTPDDKNALRKFDLNLNRSDRTLYIDPSTNMTTQIVFEDFVKGPDWRIMAEGGRYSFRVILYKEDHNSFKELWRADGNYLDNQKS